MIKKIWIHVFFLDRGFFFTYTADVIWHSYELLFSKLCFSEIF